MSLNPLNSRGSDSTDANCLRNGTMGVLIPLTVGEVVQPYMIMVTLAIPYYLVC